VGKPDTRAAPKPKSLAVLAAQQTPEPRRRKAAGVAFSLLAHGAALLAILYLHHDAPMMQAGEDGPMMMAALVDGRTLTPAPAATPQAQPQPQPQPQPAQAPKVKSFVRKALTAREDESLEADEEPAPVLTSAQIASAATAESGGAGGSGEGAAGGGGKHCNMAQLLQAALRRDAHVQTAIARSGQGAQAMFVWNGDWVRSTGQEGKGLAALREAILWEVGFAPETCRKTPMHGLVMISLHEGPGSPRIVLGQGSWRWQDILGVRD
jgi:hypothetical protein